MIVYRDRIEDEHLAVIVSRFKTIPEPYIVHIREQIDNFDNVIRTVHRKRVYMNGNIVDEET